MVTFEPMGLNIRRLFRTQRVFVLSLDGVPCSLVRSKAAGGMFPSLRDLFQHGSFMRMDSVLPPVSSVAWSTYMTGKNPAGHNIFGFIDRDPSTLKLFIPTGCHMKAKPLWERLSELGKRVVVMNVPVTSPPRPVNGILIAGFLATDIEKAVYPPSLVPLLKEWGYQIDIDAQRARADRSFLIEDLKRSTQRRLAVATRLMEQEPWDFFHLHIMGTDRINHFLWRRWEDGDPCFAPAFEEYYRSLDRFIGQTLVPFLDTKKGVNLVILSDHGFCRLHREVLLNRWLEEQGLLKLKCRSANSVEDMHPDSTAYSLIPGRIYLNLQGREPQGRVRPDRYRETLEGLREALFDLRDPETGERIIASVHLRDEIYKGAYLTQAPDMVALPCPGYDLKGNVNQPALTRESDLEGMHTFDDAFLFIRDREIRREHFSILDVTPTLLDLLGCKPFRDLEGRSLI
ncbi:MAG: alkaline phosphatase family protein [bacterium]